MKGAYVIIVLLVAVIFGLVAALVFGGLAAQGVIVPPAALWSMLVTGAVVFIAIATLGLTMVNMLV